MNWRPNKHKLPKSKILLLKIFSILSYSKSNNKHSVPTWYIQNSLYLNHLLKTQCWGYLGLMTIEVEWNSKKPSAVCTVTEIPFFDELPKEENHSFLSLIYLFSSTFNVLCWTYHLMCLSHPWGLIRPAISRLWNLMTCICT